ncbi:hypothetical protein ACERK3_11520 [Phycisphaerales bacterium AB-hyl4]|uniref:Uncharacterized protein n=1 Tax=Natronomicrosphaera hydrolytica TaxID=3242702 RepID=A0ABV4U5P4_9BACT
MSKRGPTGRNGKGNKHKRSPAQQAASRANGSKSRGPRTTLGKKVASLNAAKHGAYSLTATRLWLEDPATQRRHVELQADLAERFDPRGPWEAMLVAHLAEDVIKFERVREGELASMSTLQLPLTHPVRVAEVVGPDLSEQLEELAVVQQALATLELLMAAIHERAGGVAPERIEQLAQVIRLIFGTPADEWDLAAELHRGSHALDQLGNPDVPTLTNWLTAGGLGGPEHEAAWDNLMAATRVGLHTRQKDLEEAIRERRIAEIGERQKGLEAAAPWQRQQAPLWRKIERTIALLQKLKKERADDSPVSLEPPAGGAEAASSRGR